MKTLAFGPVQIRIMARLKEGMAPISGIAKDVYRVAEPTRSQQESVRRAVLGLERDDIVRLTRNIWGKERVWELTGKVRPTPPPKKRVKKLSVVK